jgi:signal transduction histidine kinase
MVEDLLDLARFEGGAGLIEKKPFSCQELVEEVAAREKELVTSRGLQLEVEIEPHLPRSRSAVPASTRSFPTSSPMR